MKSIKILGFEGSNGHAGPNPERLNHSEIPLPKPSKHGNGQTLIFAYYSRWISRSWDKINPLILLPAWAMHCFESTKNELQIAITVTVYLIDKRDASDIATTVTLNQNGKPLAFFLQC